MNIKKVLNSDEQIEYVSRLSFVPIYICLIFTAAFVINGFIFLNVKPHWALGTSIGVASFICAGFVLLYCLTVLEYILSTKIYITNKRVFIHTGVLKTAYSDIPRDKISGITVNQSIIGKIFDYAEIKVESSAATTTAGTKYIKKPFEFKEMLKLKP